MTSIFYDLETTDRSPIGQVLNCHFIVVDNRWERLGELSLDIRISPLQLPSPGAILVNRTAVLDHQAGNVVPEAQAMRRIADFISGVVDRSRSPVELIGFNSGKFDITYLRTSMIRNGVNPFFYGKIMSRDLLHTVRYLSATDPTFPRGPRPRSTAEDLLRLSLRLETLATAFGLLDGAQTHHSSGDTELTLSLAKLLAKRFGRDVRSTAGYDPSLLHDVGSSTSVVAAIYPNYDLNSADHQLRIPYTFLGGDHRSGLWVDLEQYREGKGREAVRLINSTSGFLHIEHDAHLTQEFQQEATAARAEFRELTVRNFYQRSTCDIEADIYRLFEVNGIDALARAIRYNDTGIVAGPELRDARVLLTRYRMANLDWTQASPDQEHLLAQYALYRYGGRCAISKSFRGELDPAIEHEAAHPTLQEQLRELETLLKTATPEDARLLLQLREFYENSTIMKVAGRELLALERAKPIKLDADDPMPAPQIVREVDRGELRP
jgi:hypothetical protein